MKRESLLTLDEHMELSCWSSVYEFFGYCMGNDIEIYFISKMTGKIKSCLIKTIRKNHSTGINLTIKCSEQVFGISFSSVFVKK